MTAELPPLPLRERTRPPIADSPRILAIDDVHLAGCPGCEAALVGFYGELIGLEPVPGRAEESGLVFTGHPLSGPRLIVHPDAEPPAHELRRRVLIQIASLEACAEQLREQRRAYAWSRGWSFFDKRLIVLDPAANLVDLVTSHPL